MVTSSTAESSRRVASGWDGDAHEGAADGLRCTPTAGYGGAGVNLKHLASGPARQDLMSGIDSSWWTVVLDRRGEPEPKSRGSEGAKVLLNA